MREIKTKTITDTVARLCQEANFYLGDDVVAALKKARKEEESPVARQILDQILEHADIAAQIYKDMEKTVRVLLIITGVKSEQIFSPAKKTTDKKMREIEKELGIEFVK